jgi:hypothetical protein
MRHDDFERFVRWYPAQWRARYGGELAALLEDTYVTANDVPVRQRLGLARSGLVERARTAGIVGTFQDPDVRLRGGAALVLSGWAFYLVAGAMFVKLADRWSTESSHVGHWAATGGFNAVAVASGLGCLFVLLAALLVLPSFVRLLRAGAWPSVRRPIVVAVVSVVASVALLGLLVARAHGMSAHGRNGGDHLFDALFVFVGLTCFAAVGCATAAGVSVARRIDLSRPLLRALGVMAIGVVSMMALALVSLVTWWASEAVHSPGFLAQTIGNGIPFNSRVVPPTLFASGLLMTAGLALGLAGLVRIVGSLDQPERARAIGSH